MIFAALGILGAILTISAYALLVFEKIPAEGLYPALNLIASLLIAISLFGQWNIATAILQFFFGGLSGWALIRKFRD